MIRPRRFINLNTRVYAASVVQRDAPIRTFAMAPMKPIAADKITEPEFNDLLSHYPSLIKLIDTSKPAKPGQKPLTELDEYRYVEAVEKFGGQGSKSPMEIDDIKALVEWKLRHGKFRPTLMSLVASNDPKAAKDTISQAMAVYQDTADVSKTLDVLTKLRGIGPATASLLLSVHDPEQVLFFSDEAFYWLCSGGKKAPIKYNAKEYTVLRAEAESLVKRLGVSATDVEKVAYVVMKREGEAAQPTESAEKKVPIAAAKAAKRDTAPKPDTKRKVAPGTPVEAEGTTLRRSKRTKA